MRSQTISPFLGKLPLPLTRFLYLCLPGEALMVWVSQVQPDLHEGLWAPLRPLGLPGRVKGSSVHILPTQHPVVLNHKVSISLIKKEPSSHLLHAASQRAFGHLEGCAESAVRPGIESSSPSPPAKE